MLPLSVKGLGDLAMRSLQMFAAAEGGGTARTAANSAIGDSVDVLRRSSLGLVELKRVFKVQFDQLESQGYFQQDLGCSGYDPGVVPAIGGADPRAKCLRALQELDLWPVRATIAAWSEEDLFAVLKFLHNHVSKPKRRPHRWWVGGAWRYVEFDRHAGRAQFRQTVNRALGVYKCGFELLERGDIVALHLKS
jgi:hypothetical protein